MDNRSRDDDRQASAVGSDPAVAKICCKCGIDVTGRKRMKDSDGNYYCPDCAGVESPTGASDVTSVCPVCGLRVHAAEMVRAHGEYMCEPCSQGIGGRRRSGGISRDALLAGFLVMCVLAWVVAKFLNII